MFSPLVSPFSGKELTDLLLSQWEEKLPCEEISVDDPIPDGGKPQGAGYPVTTPHSQDPLAGGGGDEQVIETVRELAGKTQTFPKHQGVVIDLDLTKILQVFWNTLLTTLKERENFPFHPSLNEKLRGGNISADFLHFLHIQRN